MRLCVKLLSVSALMLASSLAGVCQSSKKILDELFTTMADRDQFNGTVLVAEKGTVVFSGAYGKADLKSGSMLTTQSVFELGYLTKQFTAMAIMMLKEEGKLAFNQNISLFFPEIPYADVTIKNLLTHTSGIPCYYRDIHKWPDALSESKKLITNTDILDFIYESKPTINFTAGDRWAVSNTNYCLLALIVEKASGKKFAEFIKEKIFTPLEMNNSYCHTKVDAADIPGLATGYEFSSEKGEYVDAAEIYKGKGFKSNNAIYGTHGIKSTVEDLYKWDRALTENKLVKAETMEMAFTEVTLSSGRKAGYGFGWEIHEIGNDIEVSHDGAINGYLSYISKDLKQDRTIIYLRNKAAYGSRGLKRSIIKALVSKELSVPKASLTEYVKNRLNDKTGEAMVEDYMDFSYNQKDDWYYSQIEFVVLVRDFLDAGQNEKANTILSIIESEHPTSGTYIKLGEVYERMGKYDDAANYYRKALSVDSQNAEASRRLRNITN